MAKVYQKVADETEMLEAYRSGLLHVNTSDGRARHFVWRPCADLSYDEDSMVDRYRRALGGVGIWVPEDFAILVDDAED